MSQLDIDLEKLRATHHAKSLYTVYLSETRPYRSTDLAKDLTWSVARSMAERLDEEVKVAQPNASSWSRPLHFCRLQK